jgi:small-conductance mechanosensitive channel
VQEEVSEKIKDVVKYDIWGSFKEFLNYGFQIGEGEDKVSLTIGLLFLVLFAILLSHFILKSVRILYTKNLDEIDKLKFISVFKFIKYVVYIVVLFIILGTAGVNITPILAASAFLLVGIGLALQDLFQDILGGVFIILDKSLSVGDIIEVDGKVGRVMEIKLRTTRTITQDDKIIIIPNHKFLKDSIYNFTQNQKTTRENVSVGVAYGSDVGKVVELLMQSATDNKDVLKHPKPYVFFEDFGDSALMFNIYFYIKDSFRAPFIKSTIRFSIDELFRNNDVRIPFPQRDVHLFPNKKKTIVDA